MTDLEKYLVFQIRKALTVKGNPSRTNSILMEAIQNIPKPPEVPEEPARKSRTYDKTLDKAFGLEKKPAAIPLADYIGKHPDARVVGLMVCSIHQPGTLYVIDGQEESVKGVRLFAIRVVKGKSKGGEGQVFHGVPETWLACEDN